MNIENFVTLKAYEAVKSLYGDIDPQIIQVSATRKEFSGDLTLVVFPLLKISRKSPEQTANEIGDKILELFTDIDSYNVIKGFLNLKFSNKFWIERFADIAKNDKFGFAEKTGKNIMVEYSSPNTNKPLHLGHIRNNLLGFSVAQILEACGNNV
ncbi:MAG: arginine--tRNA ligase, partial [Rikenellaceae bacterium]